MEIEMTPHTQFWLALSRAFLPPTDIETAGAFLDSLPEELEELCEACGIEALPAIGGLAASLDAIGTADDLLVHYSDLFLAPPMKARLNLSFYLDGALNGVSQDAVELLLAKYGFAKSEGFRDLPDHLAVALELMALLAGERDAGPDQAALVRGILLPALPRLKADIAAHAPDSPYLHLADLTLAALTPFGLPQENCKPGKPRYDKNLERGIWRHCNQCDQPYAREKELLIMARALEEQGLPTEHLKVCPDCRSMTHGTVKHPLPPIRGARSG
jgi:TorA maturation chaperone TorD